MPKSAKPNGSSGRGPSGSRPSRPPYGRRRLSFRSGLWWDGDFWFDQEAAADAVDFFPACLRHVKGEWAGQPFVLEPCERDIIAAIFGWKRKDGMRRFRTVYIEIPKKNFKSTLAAGIALLLLFADGEPGAEVYSAAADSGQAGIVFKMAKQMVKESPTLSSRAKNYRNSILFEEAASSYQVLSADAPTKHGLNPHGIVFDELHTQPNRHLWDALTMGTGARRQPLTVALTTAGYDPRSLCGQEHDYALKIIKGIIQNDTYLPVIFAARPKDDWTKESTWRRANPLLGISLKLDYLEKECKRAQEMPAYENTFKRLHLNIWTEQSVRWMPVELWDRCAGKVYPASLEGAECFGGLDLASNYDIAALELYFPDGPNGPGIHPAESPVLSFFWIPEDNMRRRSDRDKQDYEVWVRQGLVETTPGDVIDYAFIRRRINELGEQYHIREIAVDRWNATQTIIELGNDGFTMVPFGQGMRDMTFPTKELMRLVLQRRLAHGGNEVLRWMASNVAVRQDPAGGLKPDREKSGQKIDGIVALVMAIGRAMVHAGGEGGSVYEKRGLVTI